MYEFFESFRSSFLWCSVLILNFERTVEGRVSKAAAKWVSFIFLMIIRLNFVFIAKVIIIFTIMLSLFCSQSLNLLKLFQFGGTI